jgi:queuosine precursor transporter
MTILNDKTTKLYIVLCGFFIASALIAEFMGVKIFSLEKTLGTQPTDFNLFGNKYSFNLSAGVLLWPVIFVMTDIINEYYGKKGVKFLTYIGAAMISYAFFMLYFSIHLAPADFWIANKQSVGIPDYNIAYGAVFGQSLGIILGSLFAFVLGQLLDVVVFHKIKKMTGEKYLWLRATGSTLFSQLIDSFVVIVFAFYLYPMLIPGNGNPWALDLVLSIGLGNYIYKFVVAICMTPVIYGVHNLIEKYLGKELAEDMRVEAAD